MGWDPPRSAGRTFPVPAYEKQIGSMRGGGQSRFQMDEKLIQSCINSRHDTLPIQE